MWCCSSQMLYIEIIKVPLKIKIFLWYLRVTRTKDNLANRNWQGDLKCCCCSSFETIQHLFFYCHFARFIWNTFRITFGIQPPSSISNIIGSWLNGVRPMLTKSNPFRGYSSMLGNMIE